MVYIWVNIKDIFGTSLVVHWLRLCAAQCRGPGPTPGQGAIFHVLQLKARMLQLKTLHPATNTQCSQIDHFFKVAFEKEAFLLI